MYVQDFPLVCILLLQPLRQISYYPLPLTCGFFVLFPSVIFLNVVHCKSFRDSSTFSDRACDFLLQHLMIHMSKFYFCFYGENSFFHFL